MRMTELFESLVGGDFSERIGSMYAVLNHYRNRLQRFTDSGVLTHPKTLPQNHGQFTHELIRGYCIPRDHAKRASIENCITKIIGLANQVIALKPTDMQQHERIDAMYLFRDLREYLFDIAQHVAFKISNGSFTWYGSAEIPMEDMTGYMRVGTDHVGDMYVKRIHQFTTPAEQVQNLYALIEKLADTYNKFEEAVDEDDRTNGK